MDKRIIAALALGLVASGCSGGKEAQRPDDAQGQETQAQSAPTAPKTGLVTSVSSQRIMIDDAEAPGDDTEMYERTTRSIVLREGREISWDQLEEGDVVRVTWDRGVFGPDRAARVEVLDEDEAEQIKAQMDQDQQQPGVGAPLGPREIPPGTMPGGPMAPGSGTESGPVEPPGY